MGNYPMQKSDKMTQMLAEINAIIGGALSLTYNQAERLYVLELSEQGKKTNEYFYLTSEGYLSVSDMFHYLHGILCGLRIAKNVKK